MRFPLQASFEMVYLHFLSFIFILFILPDRTGISGSALSKEKQMKSGQITYSSCFSYLTYGLLFCPSCFIIPSFTSFNLFFLFIY